MREEGRAEVLACDRTTAPQGLTLTPDQTGELVQNQCRLRAVGRVEIRGRQRSRTFCDSPYLFPWEYLPAREGLLALFYFN